MKNFIKILLLSFSLVLVAPNVSSAQCPMCRMTAESNLKNGGRQGAGLNTGILYLLVMPYLAVSTLAFLWIRNRRAAQKSEEALALQEMLNERGIKL